MKLLCTYSIGCTCSGFLVRDELVSLVAAEGPPQRSGCGHRMAENIIRRGIMLKFEASGRTVNGSNTGASNSLLKLFVKVSLFHHFLSVNLFHASDVMMLNAQA